MVAIDPMVATALDAGVQLEDDGYDIEVVDPRTLSPLDVETICESVTRTGRGVVCEEATTFAGGGAEIAAMIGEKCFPSLKAPVTRVGAPHVPMPFSAGLVDHVIPGVPQIVAAVRRVMA